MPPKNKFTRDDIVACGLEIVRGSGMEALTARSLATRLGCSVKPIFGAFESMEQLQDAVLDAANAVYRRFIADAMAAGEYPPYKASGMAYIRFAREERELFKLLFMRDRTGESVNESREEIRPILAVIQKNLGLSEDDAYLLHLEMWLCVHGIATMVATSYLDWNEAFIDMAVTDAYLGLGRRFKERGEANGSH